MMRFNGSCIEAPATGEPSAQASFEAGFKTSGIFIARIKRAGERSKQLGWIELFLLDNDKLAMCSDSSADSESEGSDRFLLFPIFDGSVFRQVKRHGHALTLMAPSYSIVLEAEAGDDRAATEASKWGRILHRLSASEQSKSSAYFKGLGISLNTLTSKPQRSKQGRKQLVPMQTAGQSSPQETSEPVAALGPQQLPSSNTPAKPPAAPRGSAQTMSIQVAPSSQAIATRHVDERYERYGGIPRSESGKSSKSAKRLSLGLAKPGTFSLDLGFGEDLKGILGALEPDALEANVQDLDGAATDEQDNVDAEKSLTAPLRDNEGAGHTLPAAVAQDVQSQKKTNQSHEPLAVPLKPFSDVNSLTPSPNSLYLQNASPSDSSLLSSSSGKELNRMESILVKEQQQQLDRYGNRAATMSSFDLSLPPKPATVSASSSSSPLATDSSPSSSNPPPGIPPPVPDEHRVRVAKRVSIAQTSPSVQYIPRDDSGADSESEAENEKDINGSLPSPEPERHQTQQSAIMRKKNPGIVKAVKKLWNKRRVPKEQHREFKGPMELLREQEEVQRQQYELPRPDTPPLEDNREESRPEPEPHAVRPSRSTAASEWKALAMVQEESGGEVTPKLVPMEDDSLKVAQAVAPITPGQATSAVPKLNSQSSISALSFRSMRSQASLSSGLTSDDSMKNLQQEQLKQEHSTKEHTLRAEQPKPEPPKTIARLDPKQDASWQQLVEQHSKAPVLPVSTSASKPTVSAAAKQSSVAPVSLDPGRFTVPDRTTNPIIRKVFESGNNKSTPALAKTEGQHSASSSYSSFGSFKRSAPSYGSQASSLSSMSYSNSASSISAPNLVIPQKSSNALEVTLLTTNLWVSKWGGTKWTPLSQLELRTDVVATSAGVRLLVMNPGGVGCTPLRFSPQCELRRVSAHDTELKTVDNTYMFRGRDPENSQKFYRTLVALQTEGVGSLNATLPTVWSSDQSNDDSFDIKRRTLVPPALSRASYAPKYMGMSTSTIVEE